MTFNAKPRRLRNRYWLTLEALEDRCLLSGFGAVGDSVTLPYFGRAVTAHNWVEELVDMRGLNFGGLSSTSGGGSYALGATGYANDWGGPNTYGALAAAVPALASQIGAGDVT